MKTRTITKIFFAIVATFIIVAIFQIPLPAMGFGSILLSHLSLPHVAMAAGPVGVVSERKLFEALKVKYKGKGMPSPSYLRIEVPLINTSGNYAFDIKKNGNEKATEVKLDRNDLFVCTRLAFYLLKEDSTKIGLARLQTYPNATYFGTLSGFTVAHLETIYNGYMQLKTGQRVNIEKLSMQEFKFVQTSQESASNSITNSEWNISEYTYRGAEDIYLHGTKSHELTVNFPTYSGMQIQTTTANTVTKLVFHPYGFLLKNCADGI
jgi:hypothetical protein